jgi:hypothetical protein
MYPRVKIVIQVQKRQDALANSCTKEWNGMEWNEKERKGSDRLQHLQVENTTPNLCSSEIPMALVAALSSARHPSITLMWQSMSRKSRSASARRSELTENLGAQHNTKIVKLWSVQKNVQAEIESSD